ncbi:hypothetical protein [Staphylococcus gallinarum]|nr:hypothetical protein [Staphylococcus gallinarum]
MKFIRNLFLLVTGILIIRALLLSIDNSNNDSIENKVIVQDKKK